MDIGEIVKQYEALVAEDKWSDALKLALDIAEVAPSYPTSWFNIGVCLDELGKHFEAAHSFQKVLDITWDDTGARYRMLRSLRLAGQRDIVLEELKVVIDTMPDFVEGISTMDPFESDFRSDARFQRLLDRLG